MNKLLIALLCAWTAAPALSQVQIPREPVSPAPALPPGLYVHVIDGIIQVSNPAGAQTFSAGQFGYTPSFQQPPVIVPNNPGLQFTPPPVFSSGSTGSGPTASGPRPSAVDCIVR